MINPAQRRAIAEDLLGAPLSAEGYAPCPGIAGHSTRNGPRDFMVILEGVPTGFCLHQNCAAPVADFNRELRSRIGRAECDPTNGPGYAGRSVARAPVATMSPKRPPFDPAKLSEFAARCPREITREWLAQRSPLPIPRPVSKAPTRAFSSCNPFTNPGRPSLFSGINGAKGISPLCMARGSFALGSLPARPLSLRNSRRVAGKVFGFSLNPSPGNGSRTPLVQ